MNFSPEAIINTKRLRIRPLVAENAQAMYRYRSDPDISRYQNWQPASLAEIENFIAEQARMISESPGTWRQYGLFESDSAEMVGDVGLHVQASDPRQVEVGITLATSFHGRGLATEALQAVLRYLFVDLEKHRVFASVDPRNAPSVALLERVGMRREAHFIESLWFKGAWADDMIYAILRREFPAGSE